MKTEKFDDEDILGPNLQKISRNNPFSVPEGYFDNLPHIIQEKCVAKRSKSLRERIDLLLLRPQLAFILILLISSIFILFQFSQKRSLTKPVNSESLASSIFLEDIDESLLIEALHESSAEKPESSESIEEYLIDNQVDLSQISEDENL